MRAGTGKDHQARAGFTLPTVVWILALVSLVIIGFQVAVRTATQLAGNAAGRAEAKALAEAGISAAILDLVEARRSQGRSHRIETDGRTVSCRTPSGTAVEIRIESEALKLDLNLADEAQLLQLLLAVGHSRAEASALAGRIADFRDPDDLRRLNGAEADDYLRAGRKTGPANAPFVAVDQAGAVLAMTEATLERMRPLVTVHPASAFTVLARARAADGSTAEIAAVVSIPLDRSRAYQVLSWTSGPPSGTPNEALPVADIGPC